MQLSSLDAKHLLVLLDRVTLSGKEVDVFNGVREKLRSIAQPPAPHPPQDHDPEA